MTSKRPSWRGLFFEKKLLWISLQFLFYKGILYKINADQISREFFYKRKKTKKERKGRKEERKKERKKGRKRKKEKKKIKK